MKALSIRQPHVEAILDGTKTREYRSRACKIRGRVLIHAARGVDAEHFDAVVAAGLPCGGLVGSVEVVGCEPEESGGFAWLLADPVRFAEPVAYTGKVGWFEVPDDVVADQIDVPAAA